MTGWRKNITLVLDVLNKFEWAIHVGFAIIILWVANKLLGINPMEFLRIVAKEIRDLSVLKISLGALNAMGFFVLLFFGVFMIVMDGLGLFSNIIAKNVGQAQTLTFSGGVNGEAVFYSLVVYCIFSVWFVSKSSG